MKTKPYYLTLFILLFLGQFSDAQVYRTSWDNATERSGWQQYQLGTDSSASWFYTPVAVLQGEVLVHGSPVGSGLNTMDNWMVSPVFNFSVGGSIDSLIFNLSGVEQPKVGDTLGIYLITGSQDPAASTWQLLKQFDSTDYLTNGGIYAQLPSIIIPATAGNSYLAFRYKSNNSQFDALFDALQITTNFPKYISAIKQEENQLEIYPNPGNRFFTIRLGGKESRIEGVLVYTLMGGRVVSCFSKGRLDLSSVAPGVYIIRVRTSNGEVLFREVVIQ
jgi:hypothetical protein